MADLLEFLSLSLFSQILGATFRTWSGLLESNTFADSKITSTLESGMKIENKVKFSHQLQ